MPDEIIIDRKWSSRFDPSGVFVETFANAYQSTLQNEGGALESICEMESANGTGNKHTFFVDKVKTKLHSIEEQARSLTSGRRAIANELKEYKAEFAFDYKSEVQKLSVDFSKYMGVEVGRSMARAKDVVKLNALADFAAGGKTGVLSAEKHFRMAKELDRDLIIPKFNQSNGKFSFSSEPMGKSGLNGKTLAKIRNILNARNFGKMSLFCVAPLRQRESLLADNSFINNDYSIKHKLEDSQIDSWQRFKFVWLNDYNEEIINYENDFGAPVAKVTGAGAGNYDLVMVFEEDYLGAVIGDSGQEMFESKNSTTMTATGFASFGAVVKDWDKGMIILCDQYSGPRAGI